MGNTMAKPMNITLDMVKQQKALLEKARNIRIKAEATIESLEAREKEELEALAKLGIDVNNPEKDLEELERKVQELYQQIEANIPYEILNEVG